MIEFVKPEGYKLLELGGGDNPHPQCDVNCDVRPGSKVNFVADFEKPLPIGDGDFHGVFCQYAIEHLSYLRVPSFLKEVFRVVKPGGRVVFVTANTEAQFEWFKKNQGGWDGKSAFDSASEVVFGSQSYEANTHRSFYTPAIVQQLFQDAGFDRVNVTAWGERQTDLLIEAVRPLPERLHYADGKMLETPKTSPPGAEAEKVVDTPITVPNAETTPKTGVADPLNQPPEVLFAKSYWNGGSEFGGYKNDQFGAAFRDFACHEITSRHILARKPASVLELGAARGYLGWRLKSAGIPWTGLEVSKHCWLTRCCDGIIQHDLCNVPWPFKDHIEEHDLNFSIAVLEHIPEQHVPAVIKEMARTCKRGLHGVDFGAKDDGFDKTHCTLRSKDWWEAQFAQHAPEWPVEVIDKELLEIPPPFHPGHVPPEWDLTGYYEGSDGLTKLNLGSYTTMHHNGWVNLDIHDLLPFAAQNRYKFVRADFRQGIPWQTGTVDLVSSNHCLEHLDYAQGLNFLRECRRAIKPTGAMRIVVPDTSILVDGYTCESDPSLDRFDEINDGAAALPTQAAKLWTLLFSGHQAAYDWKTLEWQLKNSGWVPKLASFGKAAFPQTEKITREVIDMMPELSLYVDSIPLVG